jgi:hypothetical protein
MLWKTKGEVEDELGVRGGFWGWEERWIRAAKSYWMGIVEN